MKSVMVGETRQRIHVAPERKRPSLIYERSGGSGQQSEKPFSSVTYRRSLNKPEGKMLNNYLSRGDSKISIGGRSIDKLPNNNNVYRSDTFDKRPSNKQIRSRAYKMIEKFTTGT
jgi:hypothetical protein